MTEAVVIKQPNSVKCAFCHSGETNSSKLGEKYRLRDLVVHNHCVLLSMKTLQRGKDSEGVNGFVYADIKRSLTRAKSVRCVYCDKLGAATRCQDCRKDFHLPCGINAGAVSIFKAHYATYCRDHRPRQIIPVDVLSEAQLTSPTCSACLDPVSVDDDFEALWAPCCRKTWYHRACAQSMAMHMGSLFKCAVCSNKMKFRNWMTKNGIYVPQRDASWESDESAYEILNIRHNRCDAVRCRSPYGRTVDRPSTRWEIMLCQSCGSQGTHISCSNLKFLDSNWECPDCLRTEQNLRHHDTSVICDGSNLDITVDSNDSDSDSSVVSDDSDLLSFINVVDLDFTASSSDSYINVVSSDSDNDIQVD